LWLISQSSMDLSSQNTSRKKEYCIVRDTTGVTDNDLRNKVTEMKKTIDFLKKNSLPLCLIVLGCLMFYLVKDYKQVPSGIGPAFFPKVVATLLISLSIVYIATHWNKEQKGEFVQKNGAGIKIILVCVMFIAAVLIMQYVYPLLGIFLFLFGYLCLFSQVKWWKSIIVSLVGTGVLYVMMLTLRISM